MKEKIKVNNISAFRSNKQPVCSGIWESKMVFGMQPF